MHQYYEVIGVSSAGLELEDVKREQGIRTIELEMSREITPLKDLVSLIKMVLLLKKEKPLIVHTHTPKAGIIGMLAAWITRVPHRLHTVAGLPLMESTGLKRKILSFVERLTYKCATNVYPNSFGLKDFIIENNLTTADKLKVLGNGSSNGIDTNYFSKTQDIVQSGNALRLQYKIDSSTFVFIFVGRIVKDKGINELLNSFDKLSKIEKRIKLLLIGSLEEYLDPISEESKNILHTNKNIIEAGYQNDVRPFLAIADCLVFPSYREGFPNVVMQAGSMGLPSIVSDINGCNEIIENGVNGLIIPPKDISVLYNAMYNILQDNQKTTYMAENARKMIVDRYDQMFIWQAIKSEYDLLLNNKGL
ncbi:MAG: glycosyltransferase family 4 protein [Sulfurospirillaceae bacterium]|nr:glycosyltransferase family 4 protein [Sulfurospirillaceae bacterium]